MSERRQEFVFAAIRLAQRFFNAALVRHVRVAAEPAHDVPLLISNRNRTREEPTIVPIFRTQRECVFPDLSAFKAPSNLLNDPGNMIGMMDLLPIPSTHLGKSCAGILKPAIVVPKDRTGRVSHPGKLRD